MARPRVIDEFKVLHAAREVFIAPAASANTREVAEAAGVSRGMLFQRYRTKRRLFFAAMLHSLRAALHPWFPSTLSQTHAPAGAEQIAGAVAARLREPQGVGARARDADVGEVASTLTALPHGNALAAMLSGQGAGTARHCAERAVAVLWRGLDAQPLSGARR